MTAARKRAAASPELVTVDVLDGWLVCPPGGQQTSGTVTVPADLAEQWQAAGWVTVHQDG